MGLFDSLFKRSYPTSDWPAGDGRELCFDFDKNALCGVAISERMERLRFLGPAEDAKAADKHDSLYYWSKGLFVSLDNGRIDSFVLYWVDCHEKRFAPFAGKCVSHGQEASFNRETKEQQFVRLWGEPYWRDAEDEDEILLFFERGNVEWQVELDASGNLQVINVISPPMLANPIETYNAPATTGETSIETASDRATMPLARPRCFFGTIRDVDAE